MTHYTPNKWSAKNLSATKDEIMGVMYPTHGISVTRQPRTSDSLFQLSISRLNKSIAWMCNFIYPQGRKELTATASRGYGLVVAFDMTPSPPPRVLRRLSTRQCPRFHVSVRPLSDISKLRRVMACSPTEYSHTCTNMSFLASDILRSSGGSRFWHLGYLHITGIKRGYS
jgi:hypothetical protein